MEFASKIIGTGVYYPDKIIDNNHVLTLLEQNSTGYLSNTDLQLILDKGKKALSKTGANERRWCDDNEYCTDIAVKASLKALSDAGNYKAEDIDLIIFTGMSKAFIEPATAHVVRSSLGAHNAMCFDTQDACTSFMKSIEIADSFIKTGKIKTALIVSGERTFDWADFRCKTVDEIIWKAGSLTIGDCAGAIILQATDDDIYINSDMHMQFFYNILPDTYTTCHIGLNHPIGERYKLFSHGSRLFQQGHEAMSALCNDVFSKEKWYKMTFDQMFVHDIGDVLIEQNLMAWLTDNCDKAMPECLRFYSRFGNIASSSLPLSLVLAKKEGNLKEGDTCVFFCPSAGVQAGIMMFKY